jgi:trimeric autotransporter adhesin
MNSVIQLKRATSRLSPVALLLICFALAPVARGLVPPPDGCYPAFTTAEGCNALRVLGDGVGNTAVGWYSLFSAGSASYNTGVGAGTLALTTTGADSNTAVGAAAMLLNASGFNNTAVGTDALLYNDSGSFNNAVGAFALFNNIDGRGNSAFGYAALRENIHAGSNTAIGSLALVSNDSTGNNVAKFNTAVGGSALSNNTDGNSNTAVGFVALSSNDIGSTNTAVGHSALFSNDGGSSNTAVGAQALSSNEAGFGNVAIGESALSTNVNGLLNTVIGWQAGKDVDGIDNIYIGDSAAAGITAEDFTIRIGNEAFVDACYIAGAFGVNDAASVPLRIAPSGHLATGVSSARFKQDIKPMDKASESILALKPVTFRYKNDANETPQFGLVAEDVAKVNPDLVILDREGKPYTVRYEEVNAMLLNEFLKEHRKNEEQQATIAQLKNEMQTVVARLKEADSKIQRVSDQLEMNKAAPQLVASDR